MEIPRNWRLKGPRYKLEGYKVIHSDGSTSYEFPPKANKNKSGFLLPNNQVIHGVVVRKDQEEDDKSKN